VRGDDQVEKQAVHLIRMEVVVQYRIKAEHLDRYTQAMADPHRTMLDIAWEEVGRHTASLTVDGLMGPELSEMGEVLRERMSQRVDPIGLEVVYVGVTNVHPEKSVAEAYRNVVRAEMERVAAIREARVTENERLSAAAGDAELAHLLADAVQRSGSAEARITETADALSDADPAVVEQLSARLMELEPLFRAKIEAAARRDEAAWYRRRVEDDFSLGLGRTLQDQIRAGEEAERAEAAANKSAAELEAALSPLRAEIAERLGEPAALTDDLIENVAARVAREVWEETLSQEFVQTRIAGEAAERLATASAARWQIEMQAAADLARLEHERQAYREAPRVYKARRLAEVLIEGLKQARKFFLAFDPADRTVRIRFIAEDKPYTDVLDIRPGIEE
jgi:hypothetical protein